jgi:hypothetical protein
VDVGAWGAWAAALSTVATVLLAVAAWVVRRQSREAREARKLRETNLAALRWHYRVSTLAALRGWDEDPQWPATPREMTADYLADAGEDPAGPIAQLAEAAKELGGGGTK